MATACAWRPPPPALTVRDCAWSWAFIYFLSLFKPGRIRQRDETGKGTGQESGAIRPGFELCHVCNCYYFQGRNRGVECIFKTDKFDMTKKIIKSF